MHICLDISLSSSSPPSFLLLLLYIRHAHSIIGTGPRRVKCAALETPILVVAGEREAAVEPATMIARRPTGRAR